MLRVGRVASVVGLVAVGLTACAEIQPKPFRGPNGGEAYTMRCSGMGRSMEQCFQKAGEMCPGGYWIVDKGSQTVGVPQTGGGTLIATRETLAIECK